MRVLAGILAIMLAVAAVNADNTTRKRLKVRPAAADTTAVTAVKALTDTVMPSAQEVMISGYDKPARTTKEAFFVTNKLGAPMVAAEVTIDYTDMQGRQLHSRTLWVKFDPALPAGQTRIQYISTWDKQQSFRYKRSKASKRVASTAYDVRFKVNKCVLAK